MTGVRLVFGSLLLQALNNIRPHTKRRFLTQRRNGAAETQRMNSDFASSVAPLRRCVSNFFLHVIIARSSLIVLLWHGFAGHTILALYPFPKINKLTAFRTERTDRIVFPLDWFTAGWTLHES